MKWIIYGVGVAISLAMLLLILFKDMNAALSEDDKKQKKGELWLNIHTVLLVVSGTVAALPFVFGM